MLCCAQKTAVFAFSIEYDASATKFPPECENAGHDKGHNKMTQSPMTRLTDGLSLLSCRAHGKFLHIISCVTKMRATKMCHVEPLSTFDADAMPSVREWSAASVSDLLFGCMCAVQIPFVRLCLAHIRRARRLRAPSAAHNQAFTPAALPNGAPHNRAPEINPNKSAQSPKFGVNCN